MVKLLAKGMRVARKGKQGAVIFFLGGVQIMHPLRSAKTTRRLSVENFLARKRS